MNAQEYIESGLVQDYCLGLLQGQEKRDFETALAIYPMLLAEVELYQLTMENYAKGHGIKPPTETKAQIWETLQNLEREEKMDLQNLPLINKYSDHNHWLSVVKPLLPAEIGETKFLKVITHTPKVLQILAKSSSYFEDEIHTDEMESFIILEGECECTIGQGEGAKIIHLKPGGYIEIPLHEHHDVRILTPSVTAIIQRIAI